MTKNADVNVADLVVIDVGRSTDFRSYLNTLKAAVFNTNLTVDFESLTIPKAVARKIYQRAYPKAKV